LSHHDASVMVALPLLPPQVWRSLRSARTLRRPPPPTVQVLSSAELRLHVRRCITSSPFTPVRVGFLFYGPESLTMAIPHRGLEPARLLADPGARLISRQFPDSQSFFAPRVSHVLKGILALLGSELGRAQSESPLHLFLGARSGLCDQDLIFFVLAA